jgi:PAS domain S-box-containing protein
MDFLESLSDHRSDIVKLLNSLYDGVYIVDPDRVILFWNKAAEQMTGFKAEDVIGKPCRDNVLNHLGEDGTLLCYTDCPLKKAMDCAGSGSAKVYPQRVDGSRFPVQTNVSSILDEKGKAIAGIEVFRDISLQEDYRIMQEKFTAMIRKYVSSITFNEVRERASGSMDGSAPRIIDLTVMYLDVVNFTGFSERNPNAEVVIMLNELFGICDVITRECFGDIDKFIGDAVMAVFADANDAVRSAMGILNKGLPEMNRVRTGMGQEPISIRIGINSGMVLQGEIGTMDRKDLTVIGDAVNVAARVEKASLPNRLAISATTYSRLRQDISGSFRFYKEVELRGKTEGIGLYLLEEAR